MAPERIPYETLLAQTGKEETVEQLRPTYVIGDIEMVIKEENLEEALQTPRYQYLAEFIDLDNFKHWTAETSIEPLETMHPATQNLIESVDALYPRRDNEDNKYQEKRSRRKRLIFTAEQIRRDLTEGVITDDCFEDKRCA